MYIKIFGGYCMKKCFLGIIFLILLLAGCAGSAKPAATGGKTLDQAIAEAAARIDQEIEAGSKIALLNFTSSSDQFSSYVLDELTANLLETKRLTVVDRKEVDLIRSEFDFQFSGEVGDDSIQELGRMLGAQSIVSGSLQSIGNDYRLVIRVLNVQSAAVAVQYRTDIANDNRVNALLAGGRSGGTATATAGGGRTQTGTTGGTTAPTVANIQNGTYTFYPRPRAMRDGRDINVYLDKIVVRGGFFNMYFVAVPVGNTRDSPDMGNFAAYRYTGMIYNLETPNRPPLVANKSDTEWANNIFSRLWIFSNHNVRRFRFEQHAEDNTSP